MSFFDDDPDSAELLMRDFDEDDMMDTTESSFSRLNQNEIPFFSCAEVSYKHFMENYEKAILNTAENSFEIELFGVHWKNLGENEEDLDEIENLLQFHMFDKSVEEYLDKHQIKV